MITTSTIFILIYAFSIYKIRLDSGSWEEFDPLEMPMHNICFNFFVYIYFWVGTLYGIVYIIKLAI